MDFLQVIGYQCLDFSHIALGAVLTACMTYGRYVKKKNLIHSNSGCVVLCRSKISLGTLCNFSQDLKVDRCF